MFSCGPTAVAIYELKTSRHNDVGSDDVLPLLDGADQVPEAKENRAKGHDRCVANAAHRSEKSTDIQCPNGATYLVVWAIRSDS